MCNCDTMAVVSNVKVQLASFPGHVGGEKKHLFSSHVAWE